ncbi:PTS transporter subunit EIIB [Psychromonas sp. KJ10-10]|uniref:PTS transporter subunit EIIB n=1 Tax=Psychromonas sp. KJ10-10 TaxID=3391823 RepID=UPI0039B5EC71
MEKIVQEVISAVGGTENINHCTNCLTRLRLLLKDESLVATKQVKAIKGVFGVVQAEGQYQIVLGPKKAQQATELVKTQIT